MKELILVISVIILLVVIFFTLNALNKLSMSKLKRNIIIYITIFFPIVGAIWVQILKRKSHI
jgi:hypothetical protein